MHLKPIINTAINKVFKILNLHIDDNQKWILLSVCICSLLGTYTSPTLVKVIYSALPAQWIAFSALFGSFTYLVMGMCWQGKFRKTVLNKFLLFIITESIIGFVLGLYLCFYQWNVWVYAIVSLIYSSFISTLVGKAIMSFRSKLWNEKAREDYDNNNSIVGGICNVVGFLFAFIALPSLKLSLFLWALCCLIESFGWSVVYIKNKKLLQEN